MKFKCKHCWDSGVVRPKNQLKQCPHCDIGSAHLWPAGSATDVAYVLCRILPDGYHAIPGEQRGEHTEANVYAFEKYHYLRRNGFLCRDN